MVEILTDSFTDVIKVAPLMFLIFLLVDWLVTRLNKDNQMLLVLSRYNAVGGGLLGLIPQCGISVAFAKLYSNGYITLGMLIAVFLAVVGKNTLLQPVYASLIGMIPSCFSSVFLAESYLKGAIGFGSLLAGLSANTGYGILVIIKELPIKKALAIIFMVQVISILAGGIIEIFLGGKPGGI